MRLCNTDVRVSLHIKHKVLVNCVWQVFFCTSCENFNVWKKWKIWI